MGPLLKGIVTLSIQHLTHQTSWTMNELIIKTNKGSCGFIHIIILEFWFQIFLISSPLTPFYYITKSVQKANSLIQPISYKQNLLGTMLGEYRPWSLHSVCTVKDSNDPQPWPIIFAQFYNIIKILQCIFLRLCLWVILSFHRRKRSLVVRLKSWVCRFKSCFDQ